MKWNKFDSSNKSTYPPRYEDVLVLDNGEICKAMLTDAKRTIGCDYEDIFEQEFSCDSEDPTYCCPHMIELGDVSHWMPFPKPPKESE